MYQINMLVVSAANETCSCAHLPSTGEHCRLLGDEASATSRRRSGAGAVGHHIAASAAAAVPYNVSGGAKPCSNRHRLLQHRMTKFRCLP